MEPPRKEALATYYRILPDFFAAPPATDRCRRSGGEDKTIGKF
jgi:hypothetical protein